MLTFSIIKAGTGGHVGHSAVHPAMLAEASARVAAGVDARLLVDGTVAACGDDISLIMTHTYGTDSTAVHEFAWEVFQATTRIARERGLYGCRPGPAVGRVLGQPARDGPWLRRDGAGRAAVGAGDLLPGGQDRARGVEPAAVQYVRDPFNTPGLVIDTAMHAGFRFEVYDLHEDTRIWFDLPRDLYDMLMYIGAPGRYVVHQVVSKTQGQTAAATSTQRLSLTAGKYVGKDDPVMIVRAQSGLPAVGEILEPFSVPYSVAGAMRGSHHAPFMPVGLDQAHPTRFDGPPRVVALGFQVHNGKLGQPRDLFADPSFDEARHQANVVMDYLRRHGPFEPHRLPLADLEYTTMPELQRRLASRWERVPVTVPIG
jgi:fructose 1,6-bisphosphate aldolase/phosphatase